MNRTDRILLSIALLLFLLTAGSFFGFDSYLAVSNRDDSNYIAEILTGTGDVRVKYNDQFHWEKGYNKQKLLFDDSIFTGEDSSANLKVGESDLKISENTLLVIRRDVEFKTLSLNFGQLTGKLAKGEKFVIETSDGRKVKLSAGKASKISIESKKGQTTFKVTEGSVKVEADNKVQTLVNNDKVVLNQKKPVDALEITEPTFDRVYSKSERANVRFSWRYKSNRPVVKEDQFTFEMASDEQMTSLSIKEAVAGKQNAVIPVRAKERLYYRVKDQNGVLSAVKTIFVDQPNVPVIVAPFENQRFEVEEGSQALLSLVMEAPQPETKFLVQVASDPEFKQVVQTFETVDRTNVINLPSGNYFVRAKSKVAGRDIESDWTLTRPFRVKTSWTDKRWAKNYRPSHIIIPNSNYPRNWYESSDEVVGENVSSMAEFSQFFNQDLDKDRKLFVKRTTEEEPRPIVSGQYPKDWIYPGLTDLQYQWVDQDGEKSTIKDHTLKISLEKPKHLTGNQKGQLSWSPILFAKEYELEWKTEDGRELERKRKPEAKVSALQNKTYVYRVRALGRDQVPITDWSNPYAFKYKAPEPPPVIREIAQVPQEPVASPEPVAETKSRLAPKRGIWQKVGYWLWAGLGLNYINVNQTINVADVEYENTKGPSSYLEAGFLSKTGYGVSGSFKRTPGNVQIEGAEVTPAEFTWNTYSLEALKLLPYRPKVLKTPISIGLRAGFQYHQFPFLYVADTTNVRLADNSMLAASLGFFTDTDRKKINLHWMMRYQQPVSSSAPSGNSFSITPKIAFDGSVGTSYLLNKRLKTGVFWYGQLHSYEFNFAGPAVQENAGDQFLFFSNIEWRLGYDW